MADVLVVHCGKPRVNRRGDRRGTKRRTGRTPQRFGRKDPTSIDAEHVSPLSQEQGCRVVRKSSKVSTSSPAVQAGAVRGLSVVPRASRREPRPLASTIESAWQLPAAAAPSSCSCRSSASFPKHCPIQALQALNKNWGMYLVFLPCRSLESKRRASFLWSSKVRDGRNTGARPKISAIRHVAVSCQLQQVVSAWLRQGPL